MPNYCSRNNPRVTVAVSNKVLIDRVVTGYQYIPGSSNERLFIDIIIGVSSPQPIYPQPGFVVDVLVIRELFNKIIRCCFDRRTLIQDGVPVPQGIEFPVARVPFSPSIEQTARYIFIEMKPAIERLGICLDYVRVVTPISAATYAVN